MLPASPISIALPTPLPRLQSFLTKMELVMFSMNLAFRCTSAVVCIGVLSGCTSVAPVKDVTSDPAAYMSKNFAAVMLSPSVAKSVPADAIPAGQGKLSLVTEANYESADGKKESWKNTITLTDLGQGLFQRMSEHSNNDIPYRISFSLTYRGFMDLRWQGVPLRGSMTEPLYEVKEVTRFDAVPTSENQEFAVEYSSGSSIQIANFDKTRKSCKATHRLDAKAIHAKLVGAGLEFECQSLKDNVVQGRSKWVFLQNYGVAILTESTGSSYKTVIRVVDVKA